MAAAAAEPKKTYQIDKNDPGGTIEYTWNNPEEPAGVFSFVYYFRRAAANRNIEAGVDRNTRGHPYAIYIAGLELYLGIAKSAAFAGWKVVVYTDETTLEHIDEYMKNPMKRKIKALLSDPSVIVATVRWPQYAPFPSTATSKEKRSRVDNPILRCFRYHAFVAFRCPVFVRDADTYFGIESLQDMESNVASYDETLAHFIEKVGLWEHTLFMEHSKYSAKHGTPMLYGTNIDYYRGWHYNKRLAKEVETEYFGRKYKETSWKKVPDSLGAYAGMINYLGGIREWASGELWQDSVEFIQQSCHILPVEGISSNVGEKTNIGKDEQIPLFVWLPKLFSKTFFLMFPFADDNASIMYFESSRTPFFNKAYHALRKDLEKKGIDMFEEKRGEYSSQKYWSLKNDKFFYSPYRKLQHFQQIKYIAEGELQKWIAAGLTDSEDPILSFLDMEKKYILFSNPYTVIEAFRTPKWDSMLRVLYTSFQHAYVVACREEGIAVRHELEDSFAANNAAAAEAVAAAKKAANDAAAASKAAAAAAAPPFPVAKAAAAAPIKPFTFQEAAPLPPGFLQSLSLKLGGRRTRRKRRT